VIFPFAEKTFKLQKKYWKCSRLYRFITVYKLILN